MQSNEEDAATPGGVSHQERSLVVLRIRTSRRKRRYFPALLTTTAVSHPIVALVGGEPEHHPEASYGLRYLTGPTRTYEPIERTPRGVLTTKLRRERLRRGQGLRRCCLAPQGSITSTTRACLMRRWPPSSLKRRFPQASVRFLPSPLLTTFRAACTKSMLGELDCSRCSPTRAISKGWKRLETQV